MAYSKIQLLRNYLVIIIAFNISLLCSTFAEDISLDAYASRLEIRPFPSLTLTETQFLTGDKNGVPVIIGGELRLPRKVSADKFPAVIIMHGSGGINSANQSWVYDLNNAGIATFLVDSFSGRGLYSVSVEQSKLSRFAGVLDAFKAYQELVNHPRIDSNKIALVGTSRGGTAVIYTAMRRFQQMWAPDFHPVATYPLYPSCFDKLDGDDDIIMPIHEYHGAKDDYASINQCKAWLDRLASLGKVATSIEYPNASHSYDNVLGSTTPTVSKGSPSTRLCSIIEIDGILVNQQENKPFSYNDKCVTYDPMTGYDPIAAKETHKLIIEDLKKLFADKN